MNIAIPLTNGKLSTHFGHCEEFALVQVDWENKSITATQTLAAPPHEPGLLPRWLVEKGANMIIAGGMGGRAQGLFEYHNIKVVVGAPHEAPEVIVKAYLDGVLKIGVNLCDH